MAYHTAENLVVTSPGSYGARVGGEVSVLTLKVENVTIKTFLPDAGVHHTTEPHMGPRHRLHILMPSGVIEGQATEWCRSDVGSDERQ